MKLLVTGGAGYIGSHAVYKLIEKGYKVVIIDNLERGSKKNIHPQATFYKVDLRNKDEIEKVLEKEKGIKGVLHFAGYIIVPESINEPLKYFYNNVGATINLLSIMDKYKIKNIIFSSTAAVYESISDKSILENNSLNPVNPYGESKLAAESLIKSWGYDLEKNYIIFRYFNVAGAHKNKKIGIRGKELTHLVPSILETVIGKREKFYVFGNNYKTRDGSCIRDFIHVNDLVEAHILGLEYIIKNNDSQIINLGSGKGFSVLETIYTTEKTLKIKLNYEISHGRKGDAPCVLADINKAKTILKWIPSYNLAQIIESDYEFRKEQN